VGREERKVGVGEGGEKEAEKKRRKK